MPTLKDGSDSHDVRLDRLIEFDERSRNYPIRTLLVGRSRRPRSYTWRILPQYLIDQGQEGACVGFAVVNELQARPAEVEFGGRLAATRFARESIYWEAQKIDPWPGGAYPGADPVYEGTSVLAGVKIAQNLGYFRQYRWGFSLEDLVLGVGHNGPAILGLNWYSTNYTPDAKGFIRPEGQWVGGHAIVARAIKIKWNSVLPWRHRTIADVDQDKSYFTLRNSWGIWGHQGSGDCYVTVADMGKWLNQQGESVFMVNRTVKV